MAFKEKRPQEDLCSRRSHTVHEHTLAFRRGYVHVFLSIQYIAIGNPFGRFAAMRGGGAAPLGKMSPPR